MCGPVGRLLQSDITLELVKQDNQIAAQTARDFLLSAAADGRWLLTISLVLRLIRYHHSDWRLSLTLLVTNMPLMITTEGEDQQREGL